MRLKEIKTIHPHPDFSPGALTVVLGANDTGKTTFIRELYGKFTGISLPVGYVWKWIDDVDVHIDNLKACIDTIRGSLAQHGDASKNQYIFIDFTDISGRPASGNEAIVPKAEVEQLDEIDADRLGGIARFRNPFVVYANCENRLSAVSTAAITQIQSPTTDILNAFYRFKSLFAEVQSYILERFRYHLLMLKHNMPQLELGTSLQKPVDESTFSDRNQYFREIERWKKTNFTPLQESGHGLRSMVRILEALLNEKAPLKLIDEPELHLYPGQKIWLGSMIARLSEERKSQTIVITHDPSVLQGILDENPSVTVLRFSKSGLDRRINFWKLTKSERPPTDSFRADFLTGLFHDYSITVEGESDRSFYRYMMEDAPKLAELDVAFVPCRGEGGAFKVAGLAAAVKQRAAFILDMDVVFEKPNAIQNIVNTVSGTRTLESLDKFTAVIEKLRKDNPASKWKALVGYTNRKGPDREFRTENDALLQSVLNELAGHGVFIVPRGSLESWAPDLENKVRFPENAPAYIRHNPQLKADIEAFLNRIGEFLNLKVVEV